MGQEIQVKKPQKFLHTNFFANIHHLCQVLGAVLYHRHPVDTVMMNGGSPGFLV